MTITWKTNIWGSLKLYTFGCNWTKSSNLNTWDDKLCDWMCICFLITSKMLLHFQSGKKSCFEFSCLIYTQTLHSVILSCKSFVSSELQSSSPSSNTPIINICCTETFQRWRSLIESCRSVSIAGEAMKHCIFALFTSLFEVPVIEKKKVTWCHE